MGDPLEVGERLAALLLAGQRSSSYELALVLCLLDLCVQAEGLEPGSPLVVAVDDLADRAVELYWAQVRPAADGSSLVQGRDRQRQAVVLDEVAALVAAGRAAGAGSAHATEALMPQRYAAARRRISLVLAQQPLTHLQTPGSGPRRTGGDFLFDASWLHKRITQSELDSRDRSITLLPGVAWALARTSGLLRPLVQQLWAEHVGRVNGLHEDCRSLTGFLFGADRTALAPLAEALLAAQQGRCFYCRQKVRQVHVDHFVPWTRLPLESLANLVASDERCAADKAGSLPSLALVFRWHRREPFAGPPGWPVETERVQRVLRTTYAVVPVGTALWSGRGAYEPARGDEGSRVRSLLQG